MASSPSDTVQFIVAGKTFTVAVTNLRLSRNPEALLTRAVLTATSCEDPITIDGDSELFPYILDMHRVLTITGQDKCHIPATVSKSAVIQEARRFGLMVSAEDIVEDGDELRGGGRFGSSWWAPPAAQDGQARKASVFFQDWTANQVVDWLKTFQQGRFAAHAEKFISRGIDGKTLAVITDDELKEIGIGDPKTRAVFLFAIESPWEDSGACDVNASEELKRVAHQKECEGYVDTEDETAPNVIDAAMLMLQSIFGKNGSRDMFTPLLEEWRAEHPPVALGGVDTVPTPTRALDTAKAVPCKSHKGILVAARTRPVLTDGPDSAALEIGDFDAISAASNTNVTVHSCGMQRDGVTPKIEHKPFQVHRALDSTCDEKVVSDIALPLVDTAVKHRVHSTLLCYGQTGSGKTHTVGHLAQNIVQHLYNHLDAKLVVLEAFELKGGAKGLVNTTSQALSLHADSKPELALFEGQDGAIHVGGSNGVVSGPGEALNLSHSALASSAEELLRLFDEACKRRESHNTQRNAASSRTHAFYRFHIAEPLHPEGVTGTGACIELVDLAGSESNKDSLYHNKALIDERAKINSSLQALNACIQKTMQGASYVPFRQDKLTQLLRPCFERRDKSLEDAATVLFMACLSPLASDSQQSIRTLTYTQQLTGVSSKPKQKQSAFMAEGLKRLAMATESGDAEQIRDALRIAQHNGVTGPERRRATELLQKLDAEAGGSPTHA